MNDPQGSDRIQQDVPTASGTGDNGDLGGSVTGSSFDDVPLTREEALERAGAQDDDLPAGADSDASRTRGAGASGEVEGSGPRYDAREQR